MKKLLMAGMFLIASFLVAGMGSEEYTGSYSQKEIECLAKNIYFEARGETKDGQRFVAWVTLNRTDHVNYPDNVCKVVYQKYQFSWTRKQKSIKNPDAWEKSKNIAIMVVTNKENGKVDPTHGAIMFHNKSVSPKWRHSFKHTASIGNHSFYAD